MEKTLVGPQEMAMNGNSFSSTVVEFPNGFQSSGAKYSRDSVRLMIAVLRSMLQEALNEGILRTNPVMKLGRFYRKARKLKSKIDPLTLEKLHPVEDQCRERFPEYYGFILCMGRTGMRIGEDKYKPTSIRLHPKVMAWALKEARKRGVGYQAIINEALIEKTG